MRKILQVKQNNSYHILLQLVLEFKMNGEYFEGHSSEFGEIIIIINLNPSYGTFFKPFQIFDGVYVYT